MKVYGSPYLSHLWDKSSYLGKIDRLKAAVNRAIKDQGIPQVFAVRGVSGISLGCPLVLEFGIPLTVVRKDHEKSHGIPVEGSSSMDIKTYFIVDDLIQSGNTVERIRNEMGDAKCLAIILHDSHRDLIMASPPQYGSQT